mgnify:CR=1 FL=1
MKNKGKSDLLKFTGLMGLGGILAKIFSIPHSIIFAKFLMPTGFGILQIFKTVVSYFGYVQLGILQAMTRNIPKAYAAGDITKVKKIKDLSFTWSFITLTLGIIVLWIFYYYNETLHNAISFNNIILLTVLVILSKTNSFLKPLLKSEGEFIVIGKTTLYNSTYSPLVGIFLVYFFGLNGALFALILENLFLFVNTIFLYNKYKPKLFFQFKLFVEQISKGFLIFLYRFTETSFSGIIYILIGIYYSSATLGVFSLGLASLLSVYRYSASIRMYYYREIMLTSNSEQKNNTFYIKLFKLPHIFNLFFNTILLCLFALVYFAIINSFLPKYTESIPVIYISVFGLTVYNARTFCAQFLDATNNLVKLTIYIFIGVSTGVLLTYYFLINNFSITYIALATGAAFTIMSSLIIVKAFFEVTNSIVRVLQTIISIYLISAFNTTFIYFCSLYNLFEIGIEISFLNIIKIISDLTIKVAIIFLLNYFIFSILFYKASFRLEINKIILYLLKKIKISKKK